MTNRWFIITTCLAVGFCWPLCGLSQPTASQPTASKPTASQPTASKPTASQPTASKPTASQPTASKPTTSQDATWGGVQSFQFSAIQVPVWVTNRHGVARSGLDSDDFRLFVDGQPVVIDAVQQVNENPLDMVYLLDVSGSMAIGGKLQGSIQTLDYLLSQHRPGDRWRIVAFADQQVVTVARDLAAWRERRGKLRAYGKTALFDVVGQVPALLSESAGFARGVVLFTDGNDNNSALTRQAFAPMLRDLHTPVFIIAIADGFIPDAPASREALGMRTLAEITRLTGGELMLARDTGDLPSMAALLSGKLRPHYMLTMTVERSPKDKPHRIRVEIPGKRRAALRYRQGYLGSTPNLIGGLK